MAMTCPHGRPLGGVFVCPQCAMGMPVTPMVSANPFAGFVKALGRANQVAANGFMAAVRAELARARKKYPKPLNSHHEAYAVVLEELQEAWEEVRKHEADPERIRAELVQVAAMCAMWVEDVCDAKKAEG